MFRPTTNTYAYDNICGRQRALDLCSGRQRSYFHIYICGRPTTSTRSGRLRCFGGGSLVRAGLTSPAGWNLLPAWRWCRVGLRVCSGSPLSLPSYAWINAFRNKWREWGGWWAAGVEPLPPTPPGLRARASSRLPLTRDYIDYVIVSSIFKYTMIMR